MGKANGGGIIAGAAIAGAASDGADEINLSVEKK